MTIYSSPEMFEDLSPSPWQRVGSSLAAGLGSGTSSALQILANDKMERMKTDRLKSLLQELGGGFQDPSQLALLESIIPGGSKPFIEQAKMQESQMREAHEMEKLNSTFNEMEDLVNQTGPLKYLRNYSPEIRENRQKFDSLALQLEQRGAEMVGKGTLSKPRFEFLKKRLPSSSKTKAANKGALDAWRKILEVEKTQEEVIEEEKIKSPKFTLEKNEVVMIDPEGKKRAVKKEDVKEAKKAGYKLSRG